MARIKYETAQAFANKRRHKDASSFYSTGDKIYSYGMLLAYHDSGDIVFAYKCRKCDAPSATTNTHMIALESVLGEQRCKGHKDVH